MSSQLLYCPFCGAPNELAEARPGPVQGTILCRICGQELDAPGPGRVCDAEAFIAQALGPAEPKVLPWEEQEGSLLRRWWATCWQVLLRPRRSFEAKAWVGWGWPVGFALIMLSLRAVLIVIHEAARGVQVAPSVVMGTAVGMMVGVIVTSVVVHGGLLLVGAGRAGLKRTLEVMCYAEAASLLWAVPVVGPVVGVIWELVAVVGGLAGVHGVGRLRVMVGMALAVVAAGIVIGLVWGGLVVGFLSALRLKL